MIEEDVMERYKSYVAFNSHRMSGIDGGVGNHRDLLTTRTEQVQAREWKWWMST